MIPFVSFLAAMLVTFAASADSLQAVSTKLHPASEIAIKADLKRILEAAKLPEDLISISRDIAPIGKVEIKCSSQSTIELAVHAPDDEWGATFYLGLQKLGFLFPHPRTQVSPSREQMRKACGKSFVWKPRFEYRGFHFHTMHPSEWTHGFLMGQKEIGRESLRWLARNGQNIAQVVLLEQNPETLKERMQDLIEFGHKLGVSFGVDVSFTLVQQKAFRLIGPSRLAQVLMSNKNKKKQIKSSITTLMKDLSFDFMTIEIGSSEFTSTDYKQTIEWMNIADEVLRSDRRTLFIKIHASTGQTDKVYGNFNFVAQFANKTVGVLPHTVMAFAMSDDVAPVYGRRDFKDLIKFSEEQVKTRPMWYYPETSYFIAMDIDVPLFLTDYLTSRSRDMDDIEKWGKSGHLNFSTGQEVGYWMIDWTVALLANSENRGNPYVGLELLGESRSTWSPILAFQSEFIKRQGVLEELSSSNLGDEIPVVTHPVYGRTLFRNLKSKPEFLKQRIAVLKDAISKRPLITGVKNDELRKLLEVTFLRIDHAKSLREALLLETQGKRNSPAWTRDLASAKETREKALTLMTDVRDRWNRYPEAKLFEEHENLTSYPFGYAWPAQNLHFWEREEEMIRQDSYMPWFKNIYSIRRILF